MLTINRTETALELLLDDPKRRNALGRGMFSALEQALDEADRAEQRWADPALRRPAVGEGPSDPAPPPLILCGIGPAFCAGFDLEAAVEDPRGPGPLLAEFIERLSGLNRRLRRHPTPVIAAVHGAALAGGCALLSACDFVVVAAGASLGYPVHRIGVSPAVTTPTLLPAIGAGAARDLALSGELIDGRRALAIGLATHLVEDASAVLGAARALAASLVAKGPVALRSTKAWLNELDGTSHDEPFERATHVSASLAHGEEARAMLEGFWRSRRAGRGG